MTRAAAGAVVLLMSLCACAQTPPKAKPYQLFIPHQTSRINALIKAAVDTHPEGVSIRFEKGTYHLVRTLLIQGKIIDLDLGHSVFVAERRMKHMIITDAVMIRDGDFEANGLPAISFISVPCCDASPSHARDPR